MFLSGIAVILLAATSYAGQGFTKTVEGRTTTFLQSADKVFNRVSDYNIGVGETHAYVQPSSSAIFVQRVTGKDPSAIFGNLRANGRVWIMNPGGVLIGSGARINTAGFMAASMVMGEDDFFAGRYDLQQEGAGGRVENRGEISVTGNGCAILAGASVVNAGRITAPDNHTIIAEGRRLSFDMDGDGLIRFNVDENAVSGIGDMSMVTQRDIFDAVVNNDDLLEADHAESASGGRILLSSRYSASRTPMAGDFYDSTINGMIRRSNDVGIYAIHDVNINSLVESTDGSVILMSDTDGNISGADSVRPGSVFLNADVTAENDITMDAHTGDVLGLPLGRAIAGGNGNFHGRLTGTLDQPISVDVNGDLTVAADGHVRGVSGVFKGSGGDLDVAETTPGMVFFNGIWIAHQGSLARAFAKSIVNDGAYRGTETGGMEAVVRSENTRGRGAPGCLEKSDFRARFDRPTAALYNPYPDLISDYRTCGGEAAR